MKDLWIKLWCNCYLYTGDNHKEGECRNISGGVAYFPFFRSDFYAYNEIRKRMPKDIIVTNFKKI